MMNFLSRLFSMLFKVVKNKQEKIDLSDWHIVSSFIYKHRYIYFLAVIFISGSCMLAVWIPRLVGKFTDSLQQGSLKFSDVASCTRMIIIVGIIRVTTGWIGRVFVAQYGRILTYNIRQELFKKWVTLSPSYYHKHNIGDLLSHALSDVEVVRQLVSMGINVLVNGISMLIFALYMMSLHIDWRLTLAGLGPLIAIPGIVRYFGPKIRNQSLRFQSALGSMSQMVEEMIGGIRTVKAFGNESVVINMFEEKIDTIVQEKMKFVRLSSLFSSLIPLIAGIGFIVVTSYGGFLAIQKTISLGDLIAFLLYLSLLRLPLEQLGQVLNIIQRASASLKRISELLRVVPAVYDREAPLQDTPIKGKIVVNNLTFRYPETDRDVLTDISFTVTTGKVLGIIGPMGSGKTTLTNLLLRLYEPPEGTIFIDDEDILRYPLLRLREGIAYVPQDGFLFSDTILKNIGFSDEKPDVERAKNSALITAVSDNINRFPEGFETEIGERGVRLSGGQKQRIAISRMIYKDVPIHILDDSLSAVDTRTERVILKNLLGNTKAYSSYKKNKATIIISHRLSAVRHADEILVLEEGRITERGSHSKLIKADGLYSKLWLIQSGVMEAPESVSKVIQPGLTENIGFIQSEIEEEEPV